MLRFEISPNFKARGGPASRSAILRAPRETTALLAGRRSIGLAPLPVLYASIALGVPFVIWQVGAGDNAPIDPQIAMRFVRERVATASPRVLRAEPGLGREGVDYTATGATAPAFCPRRAQEAICSEEGSTKRNPARAQITPLIAR